VIDDAMGPIILAGQASYTVAEFVNPEDDPARGFKTAWNGVQFLQSIERLRGLNPQRVYFAHDDEDYAALTTPAPS
jgi:hypothetical protein